MDRVPALTKALAHPARDQILKALGGGPASPAQIASEVGAGGAHVAYHVQVLYELGCVQLADDRRSSSSLERLYELTPGATA
jgi:DNA-binding transcriptional ArsR family regulator